MNNGTKEKGGQAVRKRYDDEGCFLQLPSVWPEAEVSKMEADLRLSRTLSEAKQKQEQTPQMGISMCEMQEVVCTEGCNCGSHCSCGYIEKSGRPYHICKELVLRDRQLTGAVQSLPRQENTRGSSALDVQVGGSHYKEFAIQPVTFITAYGLGFCEGNAIKYICRYKSKNGVEDLEKAIHYIQLLIEQEKNDKG